MLLTTSQGQGSGRHARTHRTLVLGQIQMQIQRAAGGAGGQRKGGIEWVGQQGGRSRMVLVLVLAVVVGSVLYCRGGY